MASAAPAAAPAFRSRPLAERQAEAARIASEYPGRVGVIIERSPKSRSTTPSLPGPQTKLIVPGELTIAQVQALIMGRLQLPPTQALFLFVAAPGGKHVLAPAGTQVREVWAAMAAPDGFLWLSYAGEEVFGAAL